MFCSAGYPCSVCAASVEVLVAYLSVLYINMIQYVNVSGDVKLM